MRVDLGWLANEFPDFRDFKPLKTGGQKLVISCEHTTLGHCVLKLLPYGSQYVDRELEAVQRLKLDNVPIIHRFGIAQSNVGPLLFLIEQRVEGADLSDRLRSGPLDHDELLHLALRDYQKNNHPKRLEMV